MPTIRISEDSKYALNELGGTFDKPDDVIQRLIRESGYEELLDRDEEPKDQQNMSTHEGSRSDWIESWLALLDEKIEGTGNSLNRPPGRGGIDFEIGDDCIGKIRISKAWKRDHGKIWHRFDPEVKWAQDYSRPETVAVVLDLYDRSPQFTNEDHFFVVDQQMLLENTSDAGNKDIPVYNPGNYKEPFGRYADRWEGWY